jgi:hypothetical protein
VTSDLLPLAFEQFFIQRKILLSFVAFSASQLALKLAVAHEQYTSLKRGNLFISGQLIPHPKDYKSFNKFARANKTNPAATSQKAYPESPGMVPRKASNPSTARATAIQNVTTLGSLSLSFINFISFFIIHRLTHAVISIRSF